MDVDEVEFKQLELQPTAPLEQVTKSFIEKFIPELKNINYYAQRSASAGFKSPEKAKIHLFFICDELITNQDLRNFADYIAQRAQQEKVLDKSIYTCTMPFFAGKIIEKGLKDPFQNDRYFIFDQGHNHVPGQLITYQTTIEDKVKKSSRKKTPKGKSTTKQAKRLNPAKSNDEKTNWLYWDQFTTQNAAVKKAKEISTNLHLIILAITLWLAKSNPDSKGTTILKALQQCKRANHDEWTQQHITKTFNEALEGAKLKVQTWQATKKQAKLKNFNNKIQQHFIDTHPKIQAEKIQRQFFGKIETPSLNEKFALLMLGSYKTGKTESTRQTYTSNSKVTNITAIVSRIALSVQVAKKGKLTIYESYKDIPEKDRVIPPKIATPINSVGILPIPKPTENLVILLDEFDEAMMQLMGTMSEEDRLKVLKHLIEYIKNAKHVVMTQALLSIHALEFLELAGYDQQRILINDFQPFKDQKVYIHEDEMEMYQEMIKLLKKGKKIAITCNTLSKTELIYQKLLELTNKHKSLKKVKLCLINSDTKNDAYQQLLLTNTEEGLKTFTAIIYSPTISSGNSFEDNDYVATFGFYQNMEKAGGPMDFCQSLHRNRCNTEIHLHLKDKKLDLEEDPEKLVKDMVKAEKLAGYVVKKLSKETSIDSSRYQLSIEFDPLEILQLKYQTQNNFFKNNAILTIKWILSERMGYKIILCKQKEKTTEQQNQEKTAQRESKLALSHKKNNEFIQATATPAEELDQLKMKKKTSTENIEYQKGVIQQKTGIKIDKLDELEQLKLKKFIDKKGLSIINNVEIATLTETQMILLAIHLKNNGKPRRAALYILRWWVIKGLFNMFNITYQDNQFQFPNIRFTYKDVINSTWGKFINKHWRVFNLLKLTKLNDQGLTPTKVGFIFKNLGLNLQKINIDNSLKLKEQATFATSMIEKKVGNVACSPENNNLTNSDTDHFFSFLGFEPLVDMVFNSRQEQGIKNLPTFCNKLENDYQQFSDIESWLQSSCEADDNLAQEIENLYKKLDEDEKTTTPKKIDAQFMDEFFKENSVSTANNLLDDYCAACEISLPDEFWAFASRAEGDEIQLEDFHQKIKHKLNELEAV